VSPRAADPPAAADGPPPSIGAVSGSGQVQPAPHQALYRRWRAQTFGQIVGQRAVVDTLRNAVRAGRVSHGILFVGPRGTGKTSLARILAKALNCTNLQDGDPCDRCESCVAIREGRAIDLVEIDAASNRGIGDIRDLRDRIHYAPTDLRRKVYILDEAHQITKDAWNALLKSLEEPPDFVVFIFASTHPQEFPPAILSRLQRFDVRRLGVDEIEGKLARILAAESVEAEPAAVHLIARLAAGGMRDAESMLDQVLASAGARIDEASVRDLLGLADAEAIRELADALVAGDAVAGVALLGRLDDRGRDVAIVLDQLVDQLRADLADALTVGDPARSSGLAAAAHRLAAIDPERRGVGGLRFQLELALLDAAARVAAGGAPVMAPPPRPTSLAETRPSAAGPGPAPNETARASDRRPERVAERGAGVSPPTAAATSSAATDGDASASHASASTPRGAAARSAPAARRAEPAPAPGTTTAAALAEPTSTPTDGGIAGLRAAWPEVVTVLSQSPAVKPLVLACRPVSVDGAVVTLGFPEDKAFLKDVLERRRSVLEEGIGRVLGRDESRRRPGGRRRRVRGPDQRGTPDLRGRPRRRR
jgi:DNA polymerase III subunit gamma/tau